MRPRTGTVEFSKGKWRGRITTADGRRPWLQNSFGDYPNDAEGRALARLELKRLVANGEVVIAANRPKKKKSRRRIQSASLRGSKAKLEYQGVTTSIEELAKIAGCSYAMMWVRIRRYELSPEDAVAKGATDQWKREPERLVVEGLSLTATELAQIAGIPRTTLTQRILRSGMSPLDATNFGYK